MQEVSFQINGQPVTIRIPLQYEGVRETVRTPPPRSPQPRRQEVNHHSTATYAEYFIDGNLEKRRLFSNIMIAYDWIINKINDISDIDDEWTIRSIEETVERLEDRWYSGKNGLIVAKLEDYKFRVVYVPEKNEAMQRKQRRFPNP